MPSVSHKKILPKGRVVLFFILSVFAHGCEAEPTEPRPNMQSFAEIYAQAVIFHAVADSTAAQAKVDSMLAARNLTKADLEERIQFYEQDLERWTEFYQMVVKAIEAENDKLKKAADSTRSK